MTKIGPLQCPAPLIAATLKFNNGSVVVTPKLIKQIAISRRSNPSMSVVVIVARFPLVARPTKGKPTHNNGGARSKAKPPQNHRCTGFIVRGTGEDATEMCHR